MRVTLHDIADRTGLSMAAVSKALNDKPDISPETRERVKRIAGELGYKVNIAARTLASQKTMAIGVITGYPQLSTVTERIIGIQEVADGNHYQTTIAFHGGSLEKELKQVEMLAGRIDGLIITPNSASDELVESLKRVNTPIVLMSENLPGCGYDFVGDDDEAGGAMAAEHLLASGLTRIAYFGNAAEIPSDHAIVNGVRKALAKHEVNPDNLAIWWGNSDRSHTSDNIRDILACQERPEAIFCFSDITALWVMTALLNEGIDIPEAISLIGYDNIEFAEMARVPLTTVSQPNIEIGRQAATLLFERLNNPGVSHNPKKTIYTPKLQVRGSTRQ